MLINYNNVYIICKKRYELKGTSFFSLYILYRYVFTVYIIYIMYLLNSQETSGEASAVCCTKCWAPIKRTEVKLLLLTNNDVPTLIKCHKVRTRHSRRSSQTSLTCTKDLERIRENGTSNGPTPTLSVSFAAIGRFPWHNILRYTYIAIIIFM